MRSPIAAVSAFILLAGLIAGCGSGGTTTTATKTVTVAAKTPTAPDPAETLNQLDGGTQGPTWYTERLSRVATVCGTTPTEVASQVQALVGESGGAVTAHGLLLDIDRGTSAASVAQAGSCTALFKAIRQIEQATTG